MGLDGLDWIADHPDYDAHIIEHDARPWWTSGFEKYRRAQSPS